MAKRVVLLTGGTGFIGSEITNILIKNGFQVHILTRHPNKERCDNVFQFRWDIKNKVIDEECFKNVCFAIHLAGAPIAKRWTDSYKKKIIESRVATADFLLDQMKKNDVSLECYVGASASGYYVPNTGNLLDETNPSGYGFLAQVCEQWETSHNQFKSVSKRVVINRIGLVLSKNGGALKKMLPSFAVNVAPFFGNGEQYYSCIHIADVANQFVYSLINRSLKGIYNASTQIITQKTLNKKIATALNKNVINLKIPNFLLKLAMGNMHCVVTDSFKMSGKKIENTGFSAQFPTIEESLDDLFGNKQENKK